MLKLPKTVGDHPKLAALEGFLTAAEAPLGVEGSVQVCKFKMTEAWQKAVHVARSAGHLLQGLELIEQKLNRELRGLKAVEEKTGVKGSPRMSRLLLLANDGSERFYHDADSILKTHGDRIVGCVFEISGDELGKLFAPKGGPTKALLIDDKKALGLLLRTLADEMFARSSHGA